MLRMAERALVDAQMPQSPARLSEGDAVVVGEVRPKTISMGPSGTSAKVLGVVGMMAST